MSIINFDKNMLKGGRIYVQKKKGNLSYPIHRHDCFEIIYYKGSRGKCLLNGEEFTITDGCIFFLTPEDFHKIITEDIEDAISVNLSFSQEIIASRLGEITNLSAKVLYSPDELTVSIINKLAEYFSATDELTRQKVYHLLNLLLIEIIEKGQTAGKENTLLHPIIGKVMLYILTDPSKDITLNKVAEMCHISPAYFSHIFHAQTGKTFKNWLNSVRIERACRLLEDTKLSVLEISLECGFHNLSHFGKTFKSITNITPSQYRFFSS